MVYRGEWVKETFEAKFLYHDYDFGHDDKFGLRGYVYDVDSNGNSAMLMVSTIRHFGFLL